jgi:hypothetical protein
VDSLAELNERLAAYDEADDARRIANRATTVGRDFAAEAPLLRALPGEPFEPGLTLTPRVDRYAQVMVRQCRYPVPVRLIGRRVRVLPRAGELLISEGRALVARHERCTTEGDAVLALDHYLEVLVRKPGAFPGSTALAQARKSGMFTAAHEAFWVSARANLGDAQGTRALIEVLLPHRHMRHADVVAGLVAAVTVGAVDADVVAVEARKATETDGTATEAVAPSPAAPSVAVPDRTPPDRPGRGDRRAARRPPATTRGGRLRRTAPTPPREL